MNEYFYDQVIIETPEERENKKRKQRRLFSRVFLALFIYMVASQVLSTVIYTVAANVMPEEQYLAFANSTLWSIVLSCVVQYVIAFPIFLLALSGTEKAQYREKQKLSVSDFLLLFFAGQALMLVGNIVGNILNQVIGNVIGNLPENNIATVISETPMWLIFLLMVIVAPIVEELMCRKLIIDRLSVYGDHMAIIFSAVAFGLLHGNLYQFFYATLLGALLGYVYTRTRDVRYTILMHMIINFLGSVVALPIEKAANEFYELYDLLFSGKQVNILSLFANGAIVTVYENIQYGMLIGGLFVLWHLWKKRKFKINRDKEIYLPDGEIIKGGIVNVGSILFILLCSVMMVLSIFLS